jgi:membrane fusion protein (multidrug efflux system)
MNSRNRINALMLLFAGLILGACGNQAETKPPERLTQVTVAIAATRDLPILETATGRETALGFASDYDPTRLGKGTVYVRLTFPEHIAGQLRVGQPVRLQSFGNEDSVQGAITEIRPALSITTLSREVIVAVRDAGQWRPSGSIRGEVVLGVRKGAVVVPEQAVVLRPAGAVVYVIENDVARERVVKTGIARDGAIEIVEGLAAETRIAVDGAALLTDGAKVSTRETAPGQAS